MKDNSFLKFSLIVFFAATIFNLFFNAEVDNDLWWHLKIGQDILATHLIPKTDIYSFTAFGEKVVDHEWLAEYITASVVSVFGYPGILLIKYLAGISTLCFFVLLLSLYNLTIFECLPIVLLAATIFSKGFAPRSQIYTYLIFSALQYIFCKWHVALKNNAITNNTNIIYVIALSLLFAIHANLHGGFLLCIISFAIFIGVCMLQRYFSIIFGLSSLLLAFAATLFTPYGIGLYLYIFGELTRYHPVTEWQPVSFLEKDNITLGIYLLILIFLIIRNYKTLFRSFPKEATAWQILIIGMTVISGLKYQRHTPLIPLSSACLLGWFVALEHEALIKFTKHITIKGKALISIALIIFSFLQLVKFTKSDHLNPWFYKIDYPVNATTFINSNFSKGNLVLPLEWGGYNLFHLGPKIKLSLDGRLATVYSEEIVDKTFAILLEKGGWQNTLNEIKADLILSHAGTLTHIDTLSDWRKIFEDEVSVVYGKKELSNLEQLNVKKFGSLLGEPCALFP